MLRAGTARAPVGIRAADAGEENAGLRRGRLARRDFPKRRGFFFQGEANECGHWQELRS